MEFKLSARSIRRLQGVHPDLVGVVVRAIQITHNDFGVIEGMRTLETQRQYVAKGVSRTLRSRHLTGHAVDLGVYVGRSIQWYEELYYELDVVMALAAKDMGVPIQWGGRVFRGFFDGPHFQLPWKLYPA